MKNSLTILVLSIGVQLMSQVGIGTKNPTAALDINASATNTPALFLKPSPVHRGTEDGQIAIIDNELYLYNKDKAKWFTVSSVAYSFGNDQNNSSGVLKYSGDITAIGPMLPRDGTIIGITVNSTAMSSSSKDINVKIKSSSGSTLTTKSFKVQNKKLNRQDLNIAFNEGNSLMVELDSSGGNIKNPVVVVFVKWHKTNN